MPRRGRHRTRLPARLLAGLAALLVTGAAVFLGGTAFAGSSAGDAIAALTGSSSSDKSSDKSSDSGSSDGDSAGSSDSGSDDGSQDDKSDDGSQDGKSDDGSQDGKSDDGSQDDKSDDGSKDGKSDDGQDTGQDRSGEGQDAQDEGQGGGQENEQPDEAKKTDKQKQKDQDEKKDDPFPGRDEIGKAGAGDFVDIDDVPEGQPGDGGNFSGGSYSVRCGTSDHNNSDNYMAAPGKRNGAQHVHDYVGNTTTNANSSDDSLEAGGTSCANGDKSTFFWPVLRDLNGSGSDAGADGGGKDGNVGSILTPISADLTFHGHGSEPVEDLPQHLMIITGNAKAKSQGGKNENSKYTCSGFTDRVTTKYPICPAGSKLMRILDYPSCWDGENLESKDQRSHMAFPDSSGNCSDGKKPVPALRITLTYDQPAGRAFSIDSFPDQQHSPATDHSDFENLASTAQATTGADCIRDNRRCVNP